MVFKHCMLPTLVFCSALIFRALTNAFRSSSAHREERELASRDLPPGDEKVLPLSFILFIWQELAGKHSSVQKEIVFPILVEGRGEAVPILNVSPYARKTYTRYSVLIYFQSAVMSAVKINRPYFKVNKYCPLAQIIVFVFIILWDICYQTEVVAGVCAPASLHSCISASKNKHRYF